MIRSVQINLKHSKSATENLIIYMKTNNIDISFIQEPWVNGNLIKGLNSKEFELFYKVPAIGCRPRACILVKKNTNAFLLNNFSNEDTATVSMESGGKSITLVSAYLAHDEEIPSRIIQQIKNSRENIVLACDANARHVAWGNIESNERGECLADFINSNNFNLHNRGNTPTFIFPSSEDFQGWEAILDVTLSKSSRDITLVENWMVSLENSFSDHRFILFDITFKVEVREPFRNPRNTDWEKFKRIVYSRLKTDENLPSTGDIDREINLINHTFQEAFNISCKARKGKQSAFPPYFTNEIIELRRKARQQFNISHKNGDWASYKKLYNLYKSKCRAAKTSAWKEYCEEIESTTDTARLRKVLAKTHSSPTFIMNADGSWAESSKETNEIMLATHFPGCKDQCDPELLRTYSSDVSNFGNEIITEEKVRWAIKTFEPYKSPGPDGITPKMLQVTESRIVPRLTSIFRSCINLGHIPDPWKSVRVVFIPKAGKVNHSTAKDHRPISLSSFILKTLERILDEYIRGLFRPDIISPSQHAYVKGKSVDTALHEVVGTIESSLQYNQYTLVAFLDIEGAFNNVKLEAIINSLESINVDKAISSWIAKMLVSREIHSTIGDSSLRKYVSRGTPQGGVLSPLLWLLVINTILLELKAIGIRTVAYADDVVIPIPGMFVSTLSERMQAALSALSKWANRCGLGVNSQKTELVLFRKGYTVPTFRLPTINGTALVLNEKAKFLGVILDSRLTWKANLEERTRKAQVAYFICQKAFGKTWGLTPKLVYWIFTAVVRPILMYGAAIWWPSLGADSNCRRLDRIARQVGIGITGALRSTASDALLSILSIPPSKIYAEYSGARTAARLTALGLWKSKPYGHSRILDTWRLKIPKRIDSCTTHLAFSKKYSVEFPSRESWQDESPVQDFHRVVYTDGSKKLSGCGAGFYFSDNGVKNCFRLHNDSSIFQCEIYAIHTAASTALAITEKGKKIAFCVDSQAALKALDSIKTNSIMVRDCKEILNELGRKCEVNLIWTPGHSNIEGNEIADFVANCGADKHISWVEKTPLPLSSLYQEIQNNLIRRCQRFWERSEGFFKSSIGTPSRKVTEKLINFDRRTLRKITFISTGHWPIGRHARRMRIQGDLECPSCGLTSMETDCFHFWCQCPALCRLRLSIFGKYTINGTEELEGLPLSQKLEFILKSKWFDN